MEIVYLVRKSIWLHVTVEKTKMLLIVLKLHTHAKMYVVGYWTVDIIHVKINAIKEPVDLVKKLQSYKKLVHVDHIQLKC